MRSKAADRRRAYLLLGCAFLFVLADCALTNSEIRDSILTLERSQFSAKGSDLTLAVCGWQPVEKLEFTRVASDLFPDSGRDRGRGFLHIEARGRGFTCASKIFFTYTAGTTGGHGTYESYTNFALFQREDPVPPEISQPARAASIRMHEERAGILHAASSTLPDRSLADFYALRIERKTGVRIQVENNGSSSFRPGALAYQNQRVLFKDDENAVVESGMLYILVTSGLETGPYRIKIIELSDAEKSSLTGWP